MQHSRVFRGFLCVISWTCNSIFKNNTCYVVIGLVFHSPHPNLKQYFSGRIFLHFLQCMYNKWQFLTTEWTACHKSSLIAVLFSPLLFSCYIQLFAIPFSPPAGGHCHKYCWNFTYNWWYLLCSWSRFCKAESVQLQNRDWPAGCDTNFSGILYLLDTMLLEAFTKGSVHIAQFLQWMGMSSSYSNLWRTIEVFLRLGWQLVLRLLLLYEVAIKCDAIYDHSVAVTIPAALIALITKRHTS